MASNDDLVVLASFADISGDPVIGDVRAMKRRTGHQTGRDARPARRSEDVERAQAIGNAHCTRRTRAEAAREKSRRTFFLVAFCLLQGPPLIGQPLFRFGFGGAPCGGVIEGKPGERIRISLVLTLSRSGIGEDEFLESWGVVLEAENLEIVPGSDRFLYTNPLGECFLPSCCAVFGEDSWMVCGDFVGDFQPFLDDFTGPGVSGLIRFEVDVRIPENESGRDARITYRSMGPPGSEFSTASTNVVFNHEIADNVVWDACVIRAEREDAKFKRGDCNGDGQATGQVTDAVFLLDYNFRSGDEPPCLAACDADGNGQVTGGVTDAVYLLQYNFRSGPPPIPPFPECGPGSRTDRNIGCETPPVCERAP